jgi:hypothetical protein
LRRAATSRSRDWPRRTTRPAETPPAGTRARPAAADDSSRCRCGRPAAESSARAGRRGGPGRGRATVRVPPSPPPPPPEVKGAPVTERPLPPLPPLPPTASFPLNVTRSTVSAPRLTIAPPRPPAPPPPLAPSPPRARPLLRVRLRRVRLAALGSSGLSTWKKRKSGAVPSRVIVMPPLPPSMGMLLVIRKAEGPRRKSVPFASNRGVLSALVRADAWMPSRRNSVRSSPP